MRTHYIKHLICLTISLLLFSGVALSAERVAIATLFQAAKAGDAQRMEEVLFESTFDEQSLGHVLLISLTSIPASDERKAFRVSNVLIDKGANVNYTDSFGRTPLLETAEKSFETVALMLLDNGANLDATDKDGRTVWSYVDGEGVGPLSAIRGIFEKARKDRNQVLAEARVTNLTAKFADGCVIVTYDLDSQEPVPVKLVAKLDKQYASNMNVKSVSGDVGSMVEPGTKREIVWAVTKDYPKSALKSPIVLDVVVSNR